MLSISAHLSNWGQFKTNHIQPLTTNPSFLIECIREDPIGKVHRVVVLRIGHPFII